MKKKLLISFGLFLVILMEMASPCFATIQSNSSSISTPLRSVTASDFFAMFREMESVGGTLGTNAVFNSDWTDSTGNGIDSHMIKNTEWGAAAILGISAYGSGSSTVNNTTSTTGNAYGIYGLGKAAGEAEMVAGVWSGDYSSRACMSNLNRANAIYKDVYSAKANKYGDNNEWAKNENDMSDSSKCIMYRGFGGAWNEGKSLSMEAIADYGNWNGGGIAATNRGSRAALVCGSGL